jgi:hypothetical protein
MKPVVQLERTGCGIAAVAAIAGVSYRQAQRTAHQLGITEQPFHSWSSLPNLALLAIKWHREQGRPCWHWVVFVRDSEGERVLDSNKSLKSHTRRGFGRMKPKWYLAVAKKG